MTQKAAICKALLDGQTLSIMNGFKLLACTNIPREIGRSVERAFNIKVDRKKKEKISIYGQPCCWFEYRLDQKNPDNKEGIEKMKSYVKEEMEKIKIKTQDQKSKLESAGLFTGTGITI